MAKILVSSIGTGQKSEGGYKKATYLYDGKKETTEFISKALTKFLDVDKLFLVGTKGSIWDSCYTQFGGSDEEIELMIYERIEDKSLDIEDLVVVEKTIDKLLLNNGSKCFLIEYGLNESELWENFDKFIQILDEIDDGDIVYIDITHAFRSLALMSFLMLQFGHIVKDKKFKIGGIFYGMLEYSKENKGITPIIDLKVFYELMEWIKAIDAFKNYGHADLLVKLFENDENIKSQTKETFNLFDKNLSLANMSALRRFIQNAKRVIPIIKSSQNHIVRLISPDIVKFIKRMDKQRVSQFQIELSQWFFENNNYALSYMVLTEALVTKKCEELGIEYQNIDNRKVAKKSLNGNDNYHKIAKIRNDIAHQRESKNMNTKKDIEKLEYFIKEVKSYINGR